MGLKKTFIFILVIVFNMFYLSFYKFISNPDDKRSKHKYLVLKTPNRNRLGTFKVKRKSTDILPLGIKYKRFRFGVLNLKISSLYIIR